MAENKTKPTDQSVLDFLMSVDHPVRRADGLVLDGIFRRVTGWEPRMWGPTMIGYGAYHFTYGSGREGDALATGFSPRKANLVLYIMPGYGHFPDIMARIGKFNIGKSCLYINKLSDVDLGAVEDLIRAGIKDLGAHWPVRPT